MINIVNLLIMKLVLIKTSTRNFNQNATGEISKSVKISQIYERYALTCLAPSFHNMMGIKLNLLHTSLSASAHLYHHTKVGHPDPPSWDAVLSLFILSFLILSTHHAPNPNLETSIITVNTHLITHLLHPHVSSTAADVGLPFSRIWAPPTHSVLAVMLHL